jgi:hypothetical protein
MDWMRTEGEAGNLRRNNQCPNWKEYEEAEAALQRAIDAVD